MRFIIKFVLIWSLICFSGLSAWKICTARIIVPTEPGRSLKYFPEFSEALFALNEIDLRENLDTKIAEGIQNRAKQALQKIPISDVPFLQVALAQSLLEKKFSRRDLYGFAKKRNIRNRRVLRSLIALDAAQNDLAGVLLNIDTLIRVGGKNIPAYQNIVLQISTRDEGRVLINEYLESRPIWGKKFLENKMANMTAFDIANVSMFLSKYASSNNELELNRDLQERFLEKLVKLGAYEQAYIHWREIFPADPKFSPPLVFDGEFLGDESYAPFNWKTFRRDNFFAEINKGEGLYASFNGGSAHVLTRQVLRLRPGKTYQLQINARWTYRQRQGKFSWEVKCLPTSKTFVTVDMVNEDSLQITKPKQMLVDFQIPNEQCDAQHIQLKAQSGQYSKRIWAITDSIKITQVGL